MKTPQCVLLPTIVAAMLGVVPSAFGQEKAAAKIAAARQALQLMVDGKFDEFYAKCDANVRSKLTLDQLKVAWTGVTGAFGVYESEIRAEAKPVSGVTPVTLLSKFAGAAVNVTISLDKDDRIAGFFFQPSAEGVAYDAPAYVTASKFREEEVTVTTGEFKLPGTLTLPVGKGPFSGVVLVHGSGPNDRDETIFQNKPFKDIAWGLASRGVAVLRYDKRTKVYGATIDAQTVMAQEEVTDDAASAIRLLIEHKSVDPKRVFLLGHSLGATAAPFIANKEKRVRGVIMLAAAARPIWQLIEDQVRYIAASDGVVTDEEQKQIVKVREQSTKLYNWTWQPNDMLLGAPAQYWKRLEVLAPIRKAKTITAPMLILQGGRDYQVSPEKDFGRWQEELKDVERVTMKLLPKMDHLFRKGEGPSTPAQYQQKGHVSVEVIELVADWIRKNG